MNRVNQSDPNEDRDMVQRAKKGDQEAVVYLVQRYNWVRAYRRIIVEGYEPEDYRSTLRLAVLEVIQKYNPDNNKPFWMRGKLKMISQKSYVLYLRHERSRNGGL